MFSIVVAISTDGVIRPSNYAGMIQAMIGI